MQLRLRGGMFGLVRNISIASKIFAVVGLLSVAAAVTLWSGLRAIQVYSVRVAAMQRAAERAIIGERVNGLINAVVMDSRGIYIAKDAAEVEKFGKPLLANLVVVEAQMARWAALLPPERLAAFAGAQQQARDFVQLRKDLVQAGRVSGAKAADAIGNNDENRANRTAFNNSILALAHQNAAELEGLVTDLSSFRTATLTRMAAISGAGILCTILLALLVVLGGITRPLARIIAAMNRLAAGATDVVVTDHHRSDEVGRMAAALEVFRAQALENLAMAEEQIAQQRRAMEDKRAALSSMADTVEVETGKTLEQIRQRTEQMAATADSMSASALRTGGSARSVSGAAAQALTNAQNVASSAERLSASIREISDQVRRSSAMVGEAVRAGQETRTAIETLNETVARIGRVAEMIGDVAARTNLLALNATIEAARAGEAGKGFAVVATEVKQLANQTARSTDEITRHIGEVRTATGASVAAVGRIEQTIAEIDAVAASIAAAVEHQGSATAEIAHTVADSAAAARAMTARIEEVSLEAEQTGEQATKVQHDATDLAARVLDLGTVVVRVVRTSTTELDRRLFERAAIDVPARIVLAGRAPVTVRVADVSEGGALLASAPDLAMGARGTLEFSGPEVRDLAGRAISFRVVRVDERGVGLAFEADAATREKLRRATERLAA